MIMRAERAAIMNGNEASVLDASLYKSLAGCRYALRQFLAFSEVVTWEAEVTPQQYQELVERRQAPTDGRSVLVVMTKKRSRLLEQLAISHFKEMLRQDPLLAESLRLLRRMGR